MTSAMLATLATTMETRTMAPGIPVSGALLTNLPTGGGGDGWTYVKLAADFSTTSATAVPITGLAMTPAASKSYVIEAMLLLRTATATVGPRPGVAWPTGMTDGVAKVIASSSATALLSSMGTPRSTTPTPRRWGRTRASRSASPPEPSTA